MSRLLCLIACAIILLDSCTSNEIANSKDVNPETIYFDYRVSAEDGNDNATVMLQYRFGGRNGTTLVLNDSSKVELDGQPIPVDSSKMTGAYYEIQSPVKSFAGTHSIVYTDRTGRAYKETFSFEPFSLSKVFPEKISRSQDLLIEIEGLNPVDYVQINLSDTAYGSNGINRLDTVKNGRMIISKQELAGFVNGPIQLELSKQSEKPVKQGTSEGGRISVSFNLRREFNLEN